LPGNKFEVVGEDRRGKQGKIPLNADGTGVVRVENVHRVSDDNRASVLAELDALPSNGITYVNLSQLNAHNSPKAKGKGITVEDILSEFEKLQNSRRLKEQRQVE